MKASEIQDFFTKHGIHHAERVEFSRLGYTVWSYRRDEKNQYVLNPRREGRPILDVEFVEYED